MDWAGKYLFIPRRFFDGGSSIWGVLETFIIISMYGMGFCSAFFMKYERHIVETIIGFKKPAKIDV